MVVKCTNAKVSNPRFRDALNKLSHKPLPAKAAMAVADFEREVKIVSDRFEGLVAKIAEANGGQKTKKGYEWTKENPMPEECEQQLDELASAEIELKVEQIVVPETTSMGKPIDYEAVIFSELRGILIKDNPKGE